MINTTRIARVALALLVTGTASAAPGGRDRMAFVQLVKHGDSVKVADLIVVPGRAPIPRFAQRLATERKWVCEVRDNTGALVWSGMLPDPFAKPRHAVGGAEEKPDTLAVLRIPYQPGYAQADCHRMRRRPAAAQGPVALGKEAAAPGAEEEAQPSFLSFGIDAPAGEGN